MEGLVKDHESNLNEAATADGNFPGCDPPLTKGKEDLVQKNHQLRKGVAPGSFIDLLVRTKDRETDESLSTSCIINQVISLQLLHWVLVVPIFWFTK